MRVAAIQLVSGVDRDLNLEASARLLRGAVQAGAQLAVLPENFAFMGHSDRDRVAQAEHASGSGDATTPAQDFLAAQAREHGIVLIGGTVPLLTAVPNKIHSACLVFDASGTQIARYDKIHLFDVAVQGGKERYRESASTLAGDALTVAKTPLGKVGLSVCYDLRFPELFRTLLDRGAEIFALPAAFTAATGAPHWRALLQARAIENLAPVIAAAQGGLHTNGRRTHGESMIVDHWGGILAVCDEGPNFAVADLDAAAQARRREEFPALAHRRAEYR